MERLKDTESGNDQQAEQGLLAVTVLPGSNHQQSLDIGKEKAIANYNWPPARADNSSISASNFCFLAPLGTRKSVSELRLLRPKFIGLQRHGRAFLAAANSGVGRGGNWQLPHCSDGPRAPSSTVNRLPNM